MAAGNRHLGHKETLNDMELRSPGAKHDLYFGFLARAVDRFGPPGDDEDPVALTPCAECGAPTTGGTCAFCRLAGQARIAEPVTLRPRKRPR